MITATVQVGNSDDKLTQAEWCGLLGATWSAIQLWASQIHFEGFSLPTASWQNACWVCEIDSDKTDRLKDELAVVARRYRQESIALTLGVTDFVGPEES